MKAKDSFIAIPDRIAAGSYLILGALCAEELTIKNCRPDHMDATVKILEQYGVEMKISSDSITVLGTSSGKNNAPITVLGGVRRQNLNIRTHEYPGFSTDLQSPLVTFLTQMNAETIVFETIFEGRFKYVEDLTQLGADITIMNPREILINGPTQFHAPSPEGIIMAHDIRAGFAVIIAAILAKGVTTIKNIHLIDRGYEQIELVLTALGVHIQRIS